MRRLSLVVCVAVAAAAGAAADPGAGPVNRWLPWHAAAVDRAGALRPWTDYGDVLARGWRFLESLPPDPRTGRPVYLNAPIFDPSTGRGLGWQHNPASLYAGLVASVVRWYAYSGDGRAVRLVARTLDYQLAHGTTPGSWSWSRVPFPTGCAGARDYGSCLAGAPRAYYGGIEPDKVGLLGLGYLHAYELTGRRRYLAAARACAGALAQHVRAGDDTHTPWPFRVDGRSGRTIGRAEYGGMLVASVQLLDEIAAFGGPGSAAARRAGDVAWRWIRTHQLDPRNRDYHRFSGYYEDVAYAPDDLNAASAIATATFLVSRPAPRRLDPHWLRDARALLAWARSYLGRGPFRSAWAIDEQRSPDRPGCCSPAGVGSETAAWAAANALLATRSGARTSRAAAVRSLAYATYFMDDRGRVSCCGAGHPHAYWFTDGYGDYLGNVSVAIGALPQLAPAGETHLVASTTIVRRIAYGRTRVAYTTFAPDSTETLRLARRPVRILAGGRRLALRTALDHAGWTLARAGPDYLVGIRHASARRVVVITRA